MRKLFLFKADCGEDRILNFEVCDNGERGATISQSGKFRVREAENYSGTYHPEKYVYTGATVGGIHTGGIHKEEAYVALKSSGNGKGIVEFIDPDFPTSSWRPDSITLSDKLLQEAKKNPILTEMIKRDKLTLTKPLTAKQLQKIENIISSGYNPQSQIALANIGSSNRFSIYTCNEVAIFLNKALAGEFHPEESELFKKVQEYQKKQKREGRLFMWLVLAGIFVLPLLIQAIALLF